MKSPKRQTSCPLLPHSPRTPPRAPKKLTATEAFNKGQLLQYLCCNGSLLFCMIDGSSISSNVLEEYEKKWEGHQPLTPDTWNIVDYSNHTSSSNGNYKSGNPRSPVVNAGELRRTRGRRRRGISFTMSSASSPVVSQSPRSIVNENKGGNSEGSVAIPKDLTDPHVKAKRVKSGGVGGLGVPELD